MSVVVRVDSDHSVFQDIKVLLPAPVSCAADSHQLRGVRARRRIPCGPNTAMPAIVEPFGYQHEERAQRRQANADYPGCDFGKTPGVRRGERPCSKLALDGKSILYGCRKRGDWYMLCLRVETP